MNDRDTDKLINFAALAVCIVIAAIFILAACGCERREVIINPRPWQPAPPIVRPVPVPAPYPVPYPVPVPVPVPVPCPPHHPH